MPRAISCGANKNPLLGGDIHEDFTRQGKI